MDLINAIERIPADVASALVLLLMVAGFLLMSAAVLAILGEMVGTARQNMRDRDGESHRAAYRSRYLNR